MASGRFLELEGIRGLAAISVVFFHIILIFYPRVAYGDGSPISVPHSSVEDFLHGNPLNVLFSGLFAVALFFVLSGFVLSIGFFKVKDDGIIKRLASRRYLRLMLPALASVMVAYILMKFGFSGYRQAATELIGGGSLSIQWNFAPHIIGAIQQGAWSIFMTGDDTYNRVLWTMQYEFFGSILVFALLFLFGRAKYRMIVFCLVLLLSAGTWYAGFILGVILADLFSRKGAVATQGKKHTISGLVVLTAGLLIGSFPLQGVDSTAYRFLLIPKMSSIQNLTVYLSLGAVMVIAATIYTESLRKIFSRRLLASLGKYTYSLYLTHMLVLLTFTPFLFVIFRSTLSYGWAVLSSVLLSVPIIGIATWFFERFIDAPSIRLSAKVARVVDDGLPEGIFGPVEKSH